MAKKTTPEERRLLCAWIDQLRTEFELEAMDVPLDVMSREVGQAGDRWLASKCGVGSMMIVEVQPAR